MINVELPTITVDLVLDRSTAKDVLHGVLHAILFHRLFGTIKPTSFEVLDITVPGVSDPETERLVNEKVEAFWRGVEGGNNKRGTITVTLSEKKMKKNYWFSVGEEEVPWEQWVINAELKQPKTDRERQTFQSSLASTLSKAIETMINYTSSERGRAVVPPITDAKGISPFPFKVTVKIGNMEVS
ncbi:autophagy-related protein [Crepidotus variabilis]|uniref:Autophagy-related protein 101 n=1 Tax=Crepidotus variabilis TaxID=179855 RepID=A0A9P6EFQ3_9AGAR|nr:autophagy-related protein [Crepidotus variabilis]